MDDLRPALTEGDRVRLINDPSREGIIRRSQREGDATHYLVFLGPSDEAWFAAKDLGYVAEVKPLVTITREAFLRRLALTKLSSRFSDVFYSYRASRTNFEVYQFKPVLKFIEMDTPGLLIADEVGLGKTIEAAIIYIEMKARADLQRVLIVCPAGLTRKWQSELLLRFDEDFSILNRQTLTAYVAQYQATEGHLPLRAIVSLESIRDSDLRELIVEAGITLDMVIFDEAHHLRNRSTKSHQVAESLTHLATRSLLLTATPLQTHEEDMFNLLELIAPGDFRDYSEFEAQLRPNAFLNRAIQMLGKAPPETATALQMLESLSAVPYSQGIVRNPIYAQAIERLGMGPMANPKEIVAMRRDLQLLNTIGHVYTRTKKRDVTGVAKRVATTIEVELTDAESAFYSAVIEWVRATSRSSTGNWGVLGFNLINRERQAASCMSASREYFEGLLSSGVSRLEMDSTDPGVDTIGSPAKESRKTIDAVERLLDAAAAIQGVDSKYDQFRTALADALNSDAGAKIIVFSFFKRTLAYLRERLVADGIDPLLITGDVKPETRARLLEDFKEDPKHHVLLSSEVGAEGLDFQFAYTIFNYDLPWNPMRVEQRIGRIDRYGQVRDKIFIVNFVLKDTIESRILTRLYDRINVFEEAVGDLEPILGDVINFLTKNLFDRKLTRAEEAELAHQVDLRISEKERDLREFESRRAELMGEDRLFDEAVASRVNTGRYVSPEELIALIEPWLKRQFPKTRLFDNPEDKSWHMQGDPDLGAHLQQGRYGIGGRDPEGRNFLQRMLAGKTVPLTFDPPLASGRPRVELIHPRHPLTQAAVDYWHNVIRADGSDGIAVLTVRTDEVPEGTYDFFLYKLEVAAVTTSLTFEPVALRVDGSHSEEVGDILLRLLVSAEDSEEDDVDPEQFRLQRSRAEAIATTVRTQRAAEAESRNEALISLRREAITRAEDAKVERAQNFLQSVGEDRIVRMKLREIENIQAAKRVRLAALNEKRRVLVSINEVAAGRLEIAKPLAGPGPQDTERDREELTLPSSTGAGGVVPEENGENLVQPSAASTPEEEVENAPWVEPQIRTNAAQRSPERDSPDDSRAPDRGAVLPSTPPLARSDAKRPTLFGRLGRILGRRR